MWADGLKTLREELKTNRWSQSAVWLLGWMFLLLLGILTVIPARYIKQSIGATLLVGGSGSLYFLRHKKHRPVSAVHTAPPTAFSAIDDAQVFLVINLGHPEPVGPNTKPVHSSPPGFLLSIATHTIPKEDEFWLELKRGQQTVPGTSYWQLKAKVIAPPYSRVLANLVEVAIDSDQLDEGLSSLSRIVSQLGLVYQPIKDSLRGLRDGRFPRHPRLKGVLLCCPAVEIRKIRKIENTLAPDDPLVVAATNSISCLVAGIKAFFPLYVICSKLEGVTGFKEFAMRLPAVKLKTAWGAAIETISHLEAVRKLLRSVAEALADMRPVALSRARRVLDAQLKVPGISKEGQEKKSYDERALIYQFPREMRELCKDMGDFSWSIATQTAETEAGALLRGVFFAGATEPDRSDTVHFDKDTRLVSGMDLIAHRVLGQVGISNGANVV